MPFATGLAWNGALGKVPAAFGVCGTLLLLSSSKEALLLKASSSSLCRGSEAFAAADAVVFASFASGDFAALASLPSIDGEALNLRTDARKGRSNG